MAGMQQNGLAKLAEELGELQQIIGKMIQYPELQLTDYERHPDGTLLRERMGEEMADVKASIQFVIHKLQLDYAAIDNREHKKYLTFRRWDLTGG